MQPPDLWDDPFWNQSKSIATTSAKELEIQIGYFQHPNFPSIPYLPSLDDEDRKLSSPSSPSMWSFTLLPTDDDTMSVSPSSPGLPVLSLPGADTDDDLLSEELGPTRPEFTPNAFFVTTTLSPSSRSLLLLDDPNDYPDPDLQKLHNLRRRAQIAERAAPQQEISIMEEDGFIPAASEARRAARWEKEKGREVAALLRLKLNGSSKDVRRGSSSGDDDEARSPPSPAPSPPHSSPPQRLKKPKIMSIPQLVAKMIFNRHEPHPVGRVRLREHGSLWSPLSGTVDDGEDEDEPDNAWAALRSRAGDC
ncbi:hypothetical protein K443DRAFT_686735 [Laccaria amethystina LaAM-08-1]|uniref:Uncharacterized protein n=1 Tax=Laccaria amethystina LaAM-08-1 TaxID=1095629 RepID=A0A0C9X1Q4_9AGAR|nr:hypothetical protein K443DRAFT_686735 [Laccaria amethystina LaAM-08-1]